MSRSTAEQYPLTKDEVFKLTVVDIDIDKDLPETKAQEIQNSVVKFAKQLQDLEDEYDEIVHSAQKVYTRKLAKQAGTLRKKYVKLRGINGSEGVRKRLKKDALLESKVIDHVFGRVKDAALVREDPLKEIEEFQEREQKRIENELQMDRYRELEGYILEEDELHQKLGLMTDERWEEYFLEVRAAFQAHKEKVAKEKLAHDRMNEAAPYTLLIEDYNAINWAELKEKRFQEILQTAKDKWDTQEKERLDAQAKLDEQKAKAAEAERLQIELEERFRKRLSLLTGCTLGDKGAYYNGKLVVSNDNIKNLPEEEFAKFLFTHLEAYSKFQEEEKARKDAEMELIRKQEAEKAKLEAARHLEEQKKREEEQRIKAEEERLLAMKNKEENSTDADLLLEYAKAWAELELPVCTTEKGQKIKESLASMINRGVEWINSNAEKL
jgi:hypothetical protein